MLKRRSARRPFTFDDDNILLGMLRDRKPIFEICAALDRSPRTVTARRSYLRRRDVAQGGANP
jgi:hypothetical protein